MKLGPSYSVCFSRDGQWLVATSERRVRLFRLPERRPFRVWRISHPSSCVFSFDSRLVLIKDTAGVLYLADLTVDDPQPRVLPHHRTEGPAPVFTRDGRAIIDGCWDGHLDVLSVPAGELVSSRSWPEDMISDIHLVEDEAFLVLHSPRATDRDSSPPPDYFSLWASPLAAAPVSECRPNLDFGRDSAISPDGKSVLLVHGAPPETLSLIDLSLGSRRTVATKDLHGTPESPASRSLEHLSEVLYAERNEWESPARRI